MFSGMPLRYHIWARAGDGPSDGLAPVEGDGSAERNAGILRSGAGEAGGGALGRVSGGVGTGGEEGENGRVEINQ